MPKRPTEPTLGALTLRIGGLEFGLTTPPDFSITEESPLYLPFVDPAADIKTIQRIPVRLEISDPDPPPDWPTIFESGESWFACRDREDPVLIFRSPTDPGKTWWRARISTSPIGIDLVFAPELVDGDAGTLANPLRYPLDQLLTMMILSQRQGCIIHAAGLASHGRGVACIGRSGAGKTTLMSLLSSMDETVRLSDDRLVIRMIDDQPVLYGTPWAGEGLVATNQSADLGALVFLHQANLHALEPIEAASAAHQLFPTTSIPWFDEQRMTGCLETIDSVVRTVPAYNLHFRNDPGVVEVIESLL